MSQIFVVTEPGQGSHPIIAPTSDPHHCLQTEVHPPLLTLKAPISSPGSSLADVNM